MRQNMNLTKIFQIAAVSLVAALGFASPANAAITSVYFSAGATCTPATNSALFTQGGGGVQVSLCMTTTASTNTCGFTAILQSAAVPGGEFSLTALDVGPNYNDSTWNPAAKPIPMAIINNILTPVDLGGTSAGLVPAAANQLLATFSLTPLVGANAGPYVIGLHPNSIIAEDRDGACGGLAGTTPALSPIENFLPLEVFTSTVGTPQFTLNRNPIPVFTSPNTTTFSTGSSNTFIVSATGNPTPTITVPLASLPAGVTFTGGAGTATLGGMPTVAAGSYPLTFTATGSTVVTQSFTLVVGGLASQTITFTSPGARTFSSTPIPLSATASPSNLTVTFGTQTPSICSVSGSNVTMVALGTCTIVASQVGNPASYQPASQVFQSFSISGTFPGAPTIGTGNAGDGQATIAFTPPASTGGLPISFYTANCGSQSANSATSPITVAGLTNNPVSPYLCSVTATNSLGTGPSSATVSVSPSAAASLVLLGVKSRKTHAAAGVFDLTIDTTQPFTSVTTEPRLVGGGHVIVFQFNNPITTVAAATASAVDHLGAPIGGTPTVTAVLGSNEVLVTFVATIPDKSRLTLTLTNVNGSGTSFPASMGFLAGDTNNSRVVNIGDVLGANGRSGNPLDQTNFRNDFNLNGVINVGDVLGINGRAGNGLN